MAEGLLVHLERSKTDQEGKGRRVEIVYGTDSATCPVRAWRTWLGASGIITGPVFRRVDRHDRLLGPLSPLGVALVVKRHMGRLGHTTGDFAGHSLRRGHATTAARNGAVSVPSAAAPKVPEGDLSVTLNATLTALAGQECTAKP